MIAIKKILFPVDLTENASKILPYVLSISETYDSMIYLFHVVNGVDEWTSHYVPHTSLDRVKEEVLKGAKGAMKRVCNEQLQRCPNFQRKIVAGDPATEILKAIDTEGIDLVIMGSNGRNGLEQTIFGSVAENVVKKSPVPVLVLNPHRLR